LSLCPSQSTTPSSPPCPPSSCRTLPHSSTTTRASPTSLDPTAPTTYRRCSASVSPRLRHLAQRHPGVPLVHAGSTMPPASHHRATDERTTASWRAQTAPLEHLTRASRRWPQAVFLLDRAARPRPTRLTVHYAWKAAAPPWVVDPGRIKPNTMRRFKKNLIYLIPEMIANSRIRRKL
jgi:hypothetical protein